MLLVFATFLFPVVLTVAAARSGCGDCGNCKTCHARGHCTRCTYCARHGGR